MKCECCMDCYKIDCCDGRCDFECGKCNMNKNNILKEKETTKDLNELIGRKLNHIRSTYIPRCEECSHWKIEWDEYYDNSYCLLKSRGMSCNKEVSPRTLEGRVRATINQDCNDIINEVVREYIKENVKDEYRKYLPFRYEGNIK